jgi:hypothetical protein
MAHICGHQLMKTHLGVGVFVIHLAILGPGLWACAASDTALLPAPPREEPAPSPRPDEETLVQLATRRFALQEGKTHLDRADEILFNATARGEPANFAFDHMQQADPSEAQDWTGDRFVRADRLIWLCTDPEAIKRVRREGLNIVGARIDRPESASTIDLSRIHVPFPIRFERCAFSGQLNLRFAELPELEIKASYAKGINAEGINIGGNLYLHGGFRSTRLVSIFDGKIGGIVGLGDAHFATDDPNDAASLRMDGTSVGGDVYLGGGFECTGQANLFGTVIGGNLACFSDAKFRNPGKRALQMGHINVRGDLLLLNGFESLGEVSLNRGTVGGKVSLTAGKFRNPGSVAVDMNGIDVRGALEMNAGFESQGEVALLDAKIGQAMDCQGGTFVNPGAHALSMDRINVKGSLFLRSKFESRGEVRLVNATVGSNVDCHAGTFSNPGQASLSMDGVDVKGSVNLSNGFESNGEVRLLAGRVGSDLDCSRGKLVNPGQASLAMDRIVVRGTLFLSDGFESHGQVRMLGAQVSGIVECRDGTFDNAERTALLMDAIRVEGSVRMTSGFRSRGAVTLDAATVLGTFNGDGGTFSNANKVSLSMSGLDLKGKLSLKKSRIDGQLDLTGANIKGDLDCEGCKFLNPDETAIAADGMQANGDAKFTDQVEVQGKASFVSATIGKTFRWNRLTASPKMELDLRSATLGSLADAQESWPEAGKLRLEGLKYFEIAQEAPIDVPRRVNWLHRQERKQDDAAEYAILPAEPFNELAAVLRSHGHESAARDILIQKEWDAVPSAAPLTQLPRQLVNRMYWAFVGYGYVPWRAAYWVTGMVLLGAVVFRWGRALFMPAKAETGTLSARVPEGYPPFNAFVYSFETLIPLVTLGQKEYWLPDATAGRKLGAGKLTAGALLRWYQWFHIMVGWVLAAALVAGLAGLMHTP